MIATLMVTEDFKRQLGTPCSKNVKSLLSYAILQGLPPAPAPVGQVKLPVRFSDEECHLALDGSRQRMGIEITGLILAALTHQKSANDDGISLREPPPLKSLKLKNDREWRQSQHDMVPELLEGVSNNKIVTLEASTGSGKALGLLATAVLDGRPALIASPTIKLIRQLVSEYKSIEIKHDYSVVVGRQAFVSEILLRQSLSDLNIQQREEVEHWMQLSKAGKTDSVLHLSWLIEDMIHACPSVSPGYVLAMSLSHLAKNDSDELSDIDDGYKSWRLSMQSGSSKTKIVFCTQTMLAVDILARLKDSSPDDIDRQQYNRSINVIKNEGNYEEIALLIKAYARSRGIGSQGVFGERVLYVDEAHMMENNIATFFSGNLSLYTILQQAKSSKSPHIKELEKAFKNLVESGKAHNVLAEISINKNADDFKRLQAFLKALKAVIKSIHADSRGYSSLKLAVNNLNRALNQDLPNHQLYLSFSPSYYFPRIAFGKRHLGSEFSILWGAYEAAALVSATLSVPDKQYEYVGQTLHIPEQKLLQAKPVVSDWLYKDVTLHLPKDAAPVLCRPSDEPEDEWLHDVAKTIDLVAKKAVGGVLVLCTSYKVIGQLSNLVNDETYDRLIQQEQGDSFEKSEATFRVSDRPIWLATGRAWTGLDLRCDNNSTLLTDLVITNMPLGLNRTTSYIRRVAKMGYQNVAPYETSIALRQGIGRLKREDDGTHRHLWMLDNRAVNGNRSWGLHYSVPMKTLQNYQQIEYFTIK